MATASASPLALLEEGELAPIYFIYGKEHFLVDRAVNLIRQRILDASTRDFNYDIVYAKEAGPQKVIALCRTVPFMAKRRLVLVREADALDAKELEVLAGYAAKPIAETCLVLVAEKADQRLKFFGVLKKTGVVLKLDPLSERQLPGFVQSELRRRKLRAAPDVVELLVNEVGAELSPLCDAVERLELYVGERKTIELADIEAVVTTTRTRSVFELSDALGEGDGARALGALGSLLKAREPGLRILAMIARQVRLLLLTRSFLDEGRPKGTLAQTLSLPPFVVDKLTIQARRFDASALIAMHRAVYVTDRRLKSSRVDDERWLEALVLDLVRQKAKPADLRKNFR